MKVMENDVKEETFPTSEEDEFDCGSSEKNNSFKLNAEIVEVEINPRELSVLLQELSRIKNLKTQVVQPDQQEVQDEYKLCSDDDNDVPIDNPATVQHQQQEFIVSKVEDDFDPENDDFFYEIDDDNHQVYSDDLDVKKPITLTNSDEYLENTSLTSLKNDARQTRFSLILKKLDDYLLTKFLKTRHQHVRVQLLGTIMENHYRAEKYPTISEPTKLAKGQFMCHKCYGIYSERKLVVRHIKEAHDKATNFKCEYCPRSFVSFGTLTTHVHQLHRQIFRYNCPKCQEFKSQRKIPLIEHLLAEHQIPEDAVESLIKSNYRLKNKALTDHKCQLCDFSSKSKTEYRNHMRIKHETDPVEPECQLCFRVFLDQDSLSKHLCVVRLRIIMMLDKIQNVQGHFSCPLCSQSFEDLEYLKDHYLSWHAQDAPEVAEYQEEVRQMHEKRLKKKKEEKSSCHQEDSSVKVEEMTILCEQCPFTTNSTKQLEHHIARVHQQRYTCQHCFFSSNSVEKLSQHLNKDHEGVPSILCLKCAWPFESAQEAGDHMRAEHYQDLKHIFCKGENCDYWHKKSRDLQSHYLRAHLKEKNFLCDKCDHRAYSRADVDRHIREKHHGVFAWNCHLCHRRGLRMGFPTRKRLHRHWHWHHGVNDPGVEEVSENMDLIKNPPPVADVDLETKKVLLSEGRKEAGVKVKIKKRRKKVTKNS